jgi:8-oxo-dGTP pyrophosphatase MutT (NUDIX family)
MNINRHQVLEIFKNFTGTDLPKESPPKLESAIPASVLIPLVCREELTVLLTLRTSHLKSHAGQISFPGGQWDPEDRTPTEAALREAEEEIGLCPKSVQIISELGSWPTYSGYVITPVLGLLEPPTQFRASEDEVAEIFEIPLRYLLMPDLFKENFRQHEGQNRLFYHFDFEGRYIWGITASILRFLAQQLQNTNSR